MLIKFTSIFLLSFFLEAIIIQLLHWLTDLKVKSKVLAVGFLLITSVFTAFIENNILVEAKEIRIFIAIYYAIRNLILYVCVFRKVNWKIIYVFIASCATNQIYSNFFKQIIYDRVFKLSASYLLEIIILSLIMIQIKRKKKESVYQQLINSLSKKLYVLILVMLLIAAVFVMAATRDDTEDVIQYFLLPSMIGLVISTIAVIKIGISETEERAEVAVLSKQVENQIGYYEKINKIYGEFRSFRHDYKNHVLCLRSLIAADKKEEALEYMKTMQDMSSVGKNKYHTGNVIIDALLDDKSDRAEKVNTKIEFSGVVPTLGISNADLCVIMANAIDNAIEACSKDDSENEKTIKVDADFQRGYFFFKASNPMFEEVKFKGKNKVATSKSDKEHHGFGIANIVHTAEKYDGTTEISTEENVFIIEVQLLLKQD